MIEDGREESDYVPDMSMDKCYWCKANLTAESFAGYDKGLNLPVCGQCFETCKKILGAYISGRYFYKKK